jgi:uncharacterized protein
MIDRGEQIVRSLGIRVCRVRYHAGDVARIEVPSEWIGRLCEPATRTMLTEQLRLLGFKAVTVDLDGFRSGSLNEGIEVYQVRSLA